jgi:hypothetical protein
MAWGIFMAAFTVIGMLLLIFVQPGDTRHQTFGSVVINPPDAPEKASADSAERESVRRAA